jgi:DNA-binding transcriptional ArsR family regulator
MSIEPLSWSRYLEGMARPLHHPEPEQLDLSGVLDALSDPVRRGIVLRLAERGSNPCSAFLDMGSKTNLTYHLARLREAGVVRTRIEGSYRILSLREADLEARFPGLLAAILESARREKLIEVQEAEPPAG